MTRNTFKVFTQPDGSEYIFQAIDEADKNHGPDDNCPSNDERMYETPGT